MRLYGLLQRELEIAIRYNSKHTDKQVSQDESRMHTMPEQS